MRLGLGLCYSVLMADGSVVTFRFIGQNDKGVVMAEAPPGLGQYIELLGLLNKGYKAYWEAIAPSKQRVRRNIP